MNDSLKSGILLEQHDGIATVTLHNPAKKNAMTPTMRDRLIALFDELNAAPECRAIVLTGNGETFCAGADLSGFTETTLQAARTRLRRGGIPLMRQIVAGPKPVIGAVEGHAYGAGLALAAACDHLVAANTATFCCAFTRVGFMPDMALLHTLPHRVGMARAKQLIALADAINAQRAERLGLVDDVVPAGQALASARAIARRYADGPPLAFEMVKAVAARGLEAMLQAELDLQPMLQLSDDAREGRQAFSDRRAPRFAGK